MPNLNKVMLMGNLTRDPELRYTANNTAICNFGLAVNRRYKGQDGQAKEDTTFVECSAWGKSGEVINQYVRKGRALFIEGRLTLDQWQDQQGNNRSKLKVTVESFEFLGDKGGQQQPQQQPQPQQTQCQPVYQNDVDIPDFA